ncbi:dihydroneopterin aldolase [Elioraea rosea]|uniref:dihydroneopterin aldolase n=1 Tax=Elioraea rosea TaxID=2492390 RepID=UPI001185BC0A|nr:dihydroneopterin aldolase [Elioraea rosea]
MDPIADRRIAQAALALRHVFVRDLVLEASVGVHPHEKEAAQRIRLNIDLGVEDDGARALSRQAVGRDDLSRVVDYEAIATAARAIVSSGHVMLVETLAERIAEACLLDRRVRLARVRVEKLDAIVGAGSVGIEIERRSQAP